MVRKHNAVAQLVDAHPLVSDQMQRDELIVVLSKLQEVIDQEIAGDVVEFGCYAGTASLFIRRLLDSNGSDSVFHVYDSFNGLPEKSAQDESPLGVQFQAGELKATKAQLIDNFHRSHLKLPVIHKGWFSELANKDVPERINFAFLDGDYYESVMTPLQLIKERLSSGAVIVVDDYGNQALPGARQAVQDWVKKNNPRSFQEIASLAVIEWRP